MLHNTNCPKCCALLDLEPSMLGIRVQCAVCNLVFTTPTDAPEAAPPPDAVKARTVDRRELVARAERHRDPDPDDIQPGQIRRGNGKAITAMVLGILSITVGFGFSMWGIFAFVQSILGVAAIIFGYLGSKTEGKSMAITGMITGVLGVFASIMMAVGIGLCCYSLRTAAPPPPPVAFPVTQPAAKKANFK